VEGATASESRRSRDGHDVEALSALARRIRATCLQLAFDSKHGHLSSSMACVDVLVALFGGFMRHDPAKPSDPERDRLIFSKGHGATSLYALLAHHGYVTLEVLQSYSETDSPLGIHPCRHALPVLEMSAGSLGHGLGFAAGKAYSLRLRGSAARVVALLGDGECNEGSIWEAAMFCAAQRLDRVVAIVDNNGVQAVGKNDEINGQASLEEKFRAFGWHAVTIDGSDMSAVLAALDGLPVGKGKPCAIVARTRLGVSFMEGDVLWHYRVPSADELGRALAELRAQALYRGTP
jgi:transketolase